MSMDILTGERTKTLEYRYLNGTNNDVKDSAEVLFPIEVSIAS